MAKSRPQEGTQFIRWFGPLLDALRELGGSGRPDEVVDRIAKTLKITDDKLNETTPSGQLRFRNQVHFARLYLVFEGLLDSSRRGVWGLTDKGRSTSLTLDESRKIFRKWAKFFAEERKKNKTSAIVPKEEDGQPITGDPSGYRERLLRILQELSAKGFERLAQRLLRESGFTQVTVTGQSGDGGIDGYGTLQINPLVSLQVLFQCKKYARSVGPGQVRDFRGAMAGRADKGIIMTTGTFSADARREATRDGVAAIELIDGEKLVVMFENLELGLKPVKTYEIEESFFDEFRSGGEPND